MMTNNTKNYIRFNLLCFLQYAISMVPHLIQKTKSYQICIVNIHKQKHLTIPVIDPPSNRQKLIIPHHEKLSTLIYFLIMIVPQSRLRHYKNKKLGHKDASFFSSQSK